jgi:hypothetical protein
MATKTAPRWNQNQAGSNSSTGASDKGVDADTKQARDNAARASKLHRQANELAEHGK